MSDLFLILLGPTPQAPIRWGAFTAGQLVESGRIDGAHALTDIAARAALSDLAVALLPGEQVASRLVPAAPRGAAKLRAAAAYLIEDELGEAADGLTVEVAAGRGQPIAFAARRRLVEGWLETLNTSGIDCECLSADYLVLPSTEEIALLAEDGDRIVCAHGGAGLAIEGDLFSGLAPQLFPHAPERVRLLGSERIARLIPDESLKEWIGEPADAHLLTLYGQSIVAAPPPNFIRRRMINRRKAMAALAPWRRAGVLAASLAVLLFAGFVIDGVREHASAARWEVSMARLHKEANPQSANVDPLTFARTRLNEGGGDLDFLNLTAKFSMALENNEDVQVDRIRFNAARGDFIVSIRSPSDSAIESFKATLARAGVAAEDSGGYRKVRGYWTGEMTARTQ